ncbi:hypothetical protein H0H92_010763 [Tricholoma furcatifolium]|nr:hypothetical protein H0H92_010763 [Tricholoma furcatifolium]
MDLSNFRLSESDIALIEKLENVASITNEDILADGEIVRGQFFRKKAQDTLLRLDSGSASNAERFMLLDHITKLSLALAPIKRLPLEVLEQIFRALFPNGRNDGIDIPAFVSESPWLLGQVCSMWRRLSRSMPDLWAANHVTFSLPFEEGLEVDDADISAITEYAMNLLKQAVQMDIPEVSQLCLSVIDRRNFTPRGWIPYLSHVSDLNWVVYETLGLTRPGELSLLRRLTLSTNASCHVPPDIGVFGSSSLLQELTIQSDIPHFLFYQIPWSQLRVLSLSVSSGALTDETRSAWLQIQRLNPFRLMSSLQTLSLDLIEELYHIVLSFGFPWHQLSSLSIQGTWRVCHFHATMEALQKCTSLITLEILHSRTHDPLSRFSGAVYKPTTVFPLKSLTLDGGLPFDMVLSISTAGALVTSLDLRSVPLNLCQFYAIIEHFPRIRTLLSEIVEDGPLIPRRDENIILSELIDLSLTVRDGTTFPSLLVVPALISFMIDGPKVLDQFLHLAHHSKFDLRRFTWFRDAAENVHHPSTKDFKDLLIVLRNCFEILLHSVIPDSQEIIDEIASGQLLPQVNSLDICMPNFNTYYNAVQRRFKRNAALDMPLRFIAVFPRESRVQLGVDEYARLEELQQLYDGFHCSCFSQ